MASDLGFLTKWPTKIRATLSQVEPSLLARCKRAGKRVVSSPPPPTACAGIDDDDNDDDDDDETDVEDAAAVWPPSLGRQKAPKTASGAVSMNVSHSSNTSGSKKRASGLSGGLKRTWERRDGTAPHTPLDSAEGGDAGCDAILWLVFE